MKMSRFEKVFVNRSGHSRRVAVRVAERLARLDVRRGQRYLDVGCGNGAAAIEAAQSFGLIVTGVDIDGEQVRAAEKAATGIDGVTFRQADAAHLPFPDGSFDFVATNKTTHHIPDWREALAEMMRVVKPGGYVVYADLTVPAWMAPLLRPLVSRSFGVLTRHEVDRCFEAGGFHMVDASGSWNYEAVFRGPEQGHGMTREFDARPERVAAVAPGAGR